MWPVPCSRWEVALTRSDFLPSIQGSKQLAIYSEKLFSPFAVSSICFSDTLSFPNCGVCWRYSILVLSCWDRERMWITLEIISLFQNPINRKDNGTGDFHFAVSLRPTESWYSAAHHPSVSLLITQKPEYTREATVSIESEKTPSVQ